MLGRALLSGTLAAAAVTLVASYAARRATGSAAAALNATSHFLWGDGAARRDGYSMKYTGVGYAANYGASIFWALFYEALGRKRSAAQALRDALLVSAGAYVTDYHLVPKRLTPGFELRLSGRALACIYGAMIESGSREALFGAYALAATLMCVAAAVTWLIGIDAERKPLEQVCAPLGSDPH